MSKSTIIAVAGKGGVGKTSLSATIVRCLTEKYPDKKILAIDADPAVGLSTALGIDVKMTIDDIPFKIEPHTVRHYTEQMRVKVLDKLHDVYGVDTSDAMLRKAVEEHNEVCRLITEIGEYRKEENPRITGYEFHVINLVTYCCPKYLIIDKLRETAEELKTRVPDEKKNYRAKVVVVGSEMDDPDFTKLIEESGALVVADRFCFGSLPGREEIKLNNTDDVLSQIVLHYIIWKHANVHVI